ncbi:hypothetical protein CFOL_v3_14071, partial [Cephalotus follicularis]
PLSRNLLLWFFASRLSDLSFSLLFDIGLLSGSTMSTRSGRTFGTQADTANVQPSKTQVVENLIADVAAGLHHCGVPMRVFNKTSFLLHGMTSRYYAKLLKIFTGKTGAELEAMLAVGSRQKFWTTLSGMNMEGWLKFVDFIRTPEGQKLWAEIIHEQKLQQRGGGTFSIKEVASMNAFEVQTNDMIQVEKNVRVTSEEEIQAFVQQRREQLAADLLACKTNFSPAADYIPLSNRSLNMQCWAMYHDVQGLTGPGNAIPTNEQLETAFITYGQAVKNRHLTDFLQQGNNRDKLVTYVKAKVLKLKGEGDFRGATRLAKELAAMGVQAAVEMAEGIQDEDDEQNPDGQGVNQPGDNVFDNVVIPSGFGAGTSTGGAGGPTGTQSRQGGGGAGESSLPPLRQFSPGGSSSH